MSNPKCAICNKTAYPLESVKALDKTYHKLCFKCHTCKITLNIKTFKGLEGNVYCPVHTPVNRSSTSADSVSVKTAVSAPKKTAEGLGVASKGISRVNPDAPVVKSTDSGPAAIDQSIEVAARGESIAYEPADSQPHYEESGEQQYEQQEEPQY